MSDTRPTTSDILKALRDLTAQALQRLDALDHRLDPLEAVPTMPVRARPLADILIFKRPA